MIGALIGDIVGSRFEFHNHKSKDFELFTSDCRPTDDSVMSLAVARALLDCSGDYSRLGEEAVREMRAWGRQYPFAGYGGTFSRWLMASDPKPYGSWGNGAAMRVSACGYAARSMDEALSMARAVTEVTHNHPEGIKGAEAVASAVYMARVGHDMEEIRAYVTEHYYPIGFTLNEIRDTYRFDVSCQGSVPQALEAFFESTDFESALRGAISIGGDSDTIADVTCAVAEAYYGVPEEIRETALTFLDDTQRETLALFESVFPTREWLI